MQASLFYSVGSGHHSLTLKDPGVSENSSRYCTCQTPARREGKKRFSSRSGTSTEEELRCLHMQAAAEMLDQRLSERTGAPETQNIRGKWENIKKKIQSPAAATPAHQHTLCFNAPRRRAGFAALGYLVYVNQPPQLSHQVNTASTHMTSDSQGPKKGPTPVRMQDCPALMIEHLDLGLGSISGPN